ncbi:MAG: hypothetical protein VSS75_015090 [Candidatus Parabeggiatoa sp.]|nr:hypothetical protein [Candidatus Parabeggiatoa sp.]
MLAPTYFAKINISGTGPEGSAEAFLINGNSTANRDILFAIDVFSYADTDIEGMTEMLLNQGIRLNVMLIGDCSGM